MNWTAFLFSFKGRITRKAFWLYLLAVIVLNILISMLSPTVEVDPATPPAEMFSLMVSATPWWSWLLSLVMIYISLAVYTKRWHDQDRSGWWNLLILLTPLLFIGPLIMLVMLGFIGGTPGPNSYGEEPMV